MSFWNPSARIAEALGRDPSSPSLHSQPRSPYSQRPPESPGFALAEAWADGNLAFAVDALKAARMAESVATSHLVQAREELERKDAQLAQQAAALSARDAADAELHRQRDAAVAAVATMHERERELLASHAKQLGAARDEVGRAQKGAADACRSAGAAEGVLRTAAEQQSHRAQRAEAREAALQLEVQRLQEMNTQLHDNVKAAASAAAEEAAASERRTLLHIHLLRSALSEADVDARRLRHDHERFRVAARAAAADAEAADTAMAARIAEVERAAAKERDEAARRSAAEAIAAQPAAAALKGQPSRASAAGAAPPSSTRAGTGRRR